jgi:hypothetical protein
MNINHECFFYDHDVTVSDLQKKIDCDSKN